MSLVNTTLLPLLNDIQSRKLLLPHIQRKFVWEEEQMGVFLDSLIKKYPLQNFLFWKTKAKIRVRRFQDVTSPNDESVSRLFEEAISKSENEKILVLDGQQRLQTLYLLYRGGINDLDINGQNNTRHAWFNVAHDGIVDGGDRVRFSLENPSKGIPIDEDNPPEVCWLRLLDVGRPTHSDEGLADEVADRVTEYFNDNRSCPYPSPKKSIVRSNVNRLINVLRQDIYNYTQLDETADSIYCLKNVLEIFKRVNSGGTQLSEADLVFAVIKGGWDRAEEAIEDAADIISKAGNVRLDFNQDNALRAAALAITGRSKLETEVFQDDVKMQEWSAKWPKAEEAFKQLSDFITGELKLYHPKVMTGNSMLLPMHKYIFERLALRPQDARPGLLLEEKNFLEFFYYASVFFGWFASHTDSRIDKVAAVLKECFEKNEFYPYGKIREIFDKYDKRIKLELADISKTSRRNALLNLVYVKGVGVGPFAVKSKSNKPNIDHIYPQKELKKLYVSAYPNLDKDELSKLMSREINHIGNFRFVGDSENKHKNDELPAAYFAKMEENERTRQLILKSYATRPETLVMSLECYRQFRDERAKAILQIAQSIVNRGLPSEPTEQ
jgi:uncharacterized protein with ParB-like and HNH nuclease domain